MALTGWEVAQLLARWLMYFGVLSVVGGLFSFYLLRHQSRLLDQIKWYVLVGAFVGGLSSAAYFFVLVGTTMEDGLLAMFDPEMVSIYWGSPAGSVLFVNLIGYMSVLIALLLLGKKRKDTLWPFSDFSLSIFVVAVVFLMYAFSLAGHSVEQTWYYQLIFFTHVLISAWWLGLLFPLWLATKNMTVKDSSNVLDHFSRLATYAVFLLILCGAWLSYVLTGWQGWFSSDYVFWLLIKLALVFVILAIAAYHKWHLVPLVLKSNSAEKIQKSILIEKCVGVSILMVTALFTTFVGPPVH
ncbi:hypothetical protein MUS1_10070 [Marinomonas ushuaiensis DSM 15871]|uniref:Copper resistance protein D n=1 Tax=Marinomonas ushuaiensis DSM 15871 TaxID=1122207 RepID=X7E6T0_9GAMM|nr:CopD family protein [Marinomonas ushuaiensis]ETX11667.1 hypothetical protein MUS1_10070 [Marinomonas ushuaiensis DSM 15871]